ncbi:MAG: fumarate hydratase [Bacillota bacterium]
MRVIQAESLVETIKDMCIKINYNLGQDVKDALLDAEKNEKSNIGKNILKNILKNADIAKNKKVPMCQDTGMVVVFVEIGNDLFIKGDLKKAINNGVRQGYKEGYLRKSVVKNPIDRKNTSDNTPAVIHFDFVKGDKLKINLAAKGFGSENMSRLKMLKPSDGIDGVKKFVIDTVKKAGPNPCPPIVVGVGIGGTVDKAALIAKKALLRPIDKESKYNDLESELLEKINKLGIGPQGLGGKFSALGVNVDMYPTHIAGLPVVVNINCHASRHAEVIL